MSDFITPSRLKAERGWTASLITTFLGEPDQTAPNPHYQRAAPMRLYAMDRVHQAEASDEFKVAQAKTKSRQAGAAKAVETKRQAALQHVKGLNIEVVRLDRDTVTRRAVNSYNSHWLNHRGRSGLMASPASDQAFLSRITVNYIRHELTQYDRHLEEVARRVGCQDAVDEIRARAYAAIAHAYEWLADECERQVEERATERDSIEMIACR